MNLIEKLAFRPLPGLSSPHAQTVMACLSRPGIPPPSKPLIVALEEGDALWCNLSTPLAWEPTQKTVIMIHGLGGSHLSNYMIRVSRKLYHAGYRVLRVNLRGCGPGKYLTRLPYHGGNSPDILKVIQMLKQQTPDSPFILLGFSLGGNIALKLSAELGLKGLPLLHQTIAVCPPIDLAATLNLLQRPSNHLYHRYYLKNMQYQVQHWVGKRHFSSIYDFDNSVTAPHWGFQDAHDYYRQCSSLSLLTHIRHPCQILFANDDPFIDYHSILKVKLPACVKINVCNQGGHMGFLGWSGKQHRYFWLDNLLQTWIHQKTEELSETSQI